MPLKENAKYEEWKIHFEKYFGFLEDDVVLIGWSLGGIFLAKYISENEFPKNIRSVFLIGAPYDDELSGEDLTGGFELSDNLDRLDKDNVHIWFSDDDPVVSKEQSQKYNAKLPNADIRMVKDKNGHFIIKEFSELIYAIKNN